MRPQPVRATARATVPPPCAAGQLHGLEGADLLERTDIGMPVKLADQLAAVTVAELLSDHSIRETKRHVQVVTSEVLQLVRGHLAPEGALDSAPVVAQAD